VKRVYANGSVLVLSQSQGAFLVNGQRLKHYLHGDPLTISEHQEDEQEEADEGGIMASTSTPVP
jgi:hypothetical protein